jgi:transposase
MIEADKRKAIFLLHEEGMSLREIARRLGLSRNTVRAVIAEKGEMAQSIRKDKQQIEESLLRELYQRCEGRIQRVHEILTEEEKIAVSYPTLTRMLRELSISKSTRKRCHQVPDAPGIEMQHDTTLYTIALGEKTHKITASVLYLRYSKRRYLKFYRGFDRFKMKCFMHEALTYWGYAAATCIIDNTNLALLRGTGADAVIVPEMESFACNYGFKWCCHEKGHANRKAGEERSFWTVETNFLPGRSFECLEDLNTQALQWATERLEQRPQGKAGLIPAKAFEHECAYLTKLPAHLPAPYRIGTRDTDQYGYIAFAANYYWVPGTGREEVRVLEYADRIKLYRHRECLAEYPLPADGVKNAKFSPEGLPKPPHGPKNRREPTREEEKRLRAIGREVSAYLDWVLPLKGSGRHRFVRSLLALSRKITSELLCESIARAAKYRIEDIGTIERIVYLYLHQGNGDREFKGLGLPSPIIDEHFTEREAYREGSLTDAPDLSLYQDVYCDETNSTGANQDVDVDSDREEDDDECQGTSPPRS